MLKNNKAFKKVSLIQMNGTLKIIVFVLGAAFTAILIIVFSKRLLARLKYGKVQKPVILRKLDSLRTIEEIKNLFSDKWKKIDIDHSVYEENYIWEESDERGKWTVDFKFKENGSWGLKHDQDFINCTITYDSNETIYLSYSGGFCYP